MIDYNHFIVLASQKAEKEAALRYPDGDLRRGKEKDYLKNKYFFEYVRPPFGAMI